jgi:hypothetical protein
LLVQSPQLRYTLPTPTKVVSLIVTVPRPLCWTTLSLAELAPPPCQRTLPLPRAETASKVCGVVSSTVAGLERGDCRLTFTNIAEPDVPQRASTFAVDSLQLPGTDDDVRDCRAVVEDEHGAVAAGVSVGVAGTTAVEFLVAVVDGAGDGGGLGERDDRPRAGGDVESLGGREGCQGGEEGGGVQHCVFEGLMFWVDFLEVVRKTLVQDDRVYIFSCSPLVRGSRLDLFECLCALAQIQHGALGFVLVSTFSIAWY